MHIAEDDLDITSQKLKNTDVVIQEHESAKYDFFDKHEILFDTVFSIETSALLLSRLLFWLLRPRETEFCGQYLDDNCPYVKMHQCEWCLVR